MEFPGSCVEVHEAFVHDRGAFGEVGTQTDAVGVGNAHTGGNDVVNHPRELVHAEDHNVAALAQARAGQFEAVNRGGAEVGPHNVGQLAEDTVQVDAVRLDQAVREEVQTQVASAVSAGGAASRSICAKTTFCSVPRSASLPSSASAVSAGSAFSTSRRDSAATPSEGAGYQTSSTVASPPEAEVAMVARPKP